MILLVSAETLHNLDMKILFVIVSSVVTWISFEYELTQAQVINVFY